jgi:hypothetical protein
MFDDDYISEGDEQILAEIWAILNRFEEGNCYDWNEF